MLDYEDGIYRLLNEDERKRFDLLKDDLVKPIILEENIQQEIDNFYSKDDDPTQDNLCFLDRNYQEKSYILSVKNNKSLKSKLKKKKNKSEKFITVPYNDHNIQNQTPQNKQKKSLSTKSCSYSMIQPPQPKIPIQNYMPQFQSINEYMMPHTHFHLNKDMHDKYYSVPNLRILTKKKLMKYYNKFGQGSYNFYNQYDCSQNSEEVSKKYKTEMCKNFELTKKCEWGDMVKSFV